MPAPASRAPYPPPSGALIAPRSHWCISPVFPAADLEEHTCVGAFGASSRMAGTSPHPRPTCARARSLLTAQRAELCTAFLPGARAYFLRRRTLARVCLRRRPKGPCAHRSYSFFAPGKCAGSAAYGWMPWLGVRGATQPHAVHRHVLYVHELMFVLEMSVPTCTNYPEHPSGGGSESD